MYVGREERRATGTLNTFTAEALALVVRFGKDLLCRTRNSCLGSLIEAVRDQTRIVGPQTRQV